jgi:hypothetical protein
MSLCVGHIELELQFVLTRGLSSPLFCFFFSNFCRYNQPLKTCIVAATEAQQHAQSFQTSDLHGEHGRLE